MSLILLRNDSSDEGTKVGEQTLAIDCHVCGLCKAEFTNLEDFINHKVNVEMITPTFIPSTTMKNLMIPIFLNKIYSYDKSKEKKIISTKESLAHNNSSKPRILRTFSRNRDTDKKNSTNASILRLHQKIYSTFEEFRCKFKNCSYTFKTKGSLKRHHRRHTGERPYSCEVCGRSFTESGALSRHKRARISCANKSDADLPRYGKRMEDNKLGNLRDGSDVSLPLDASLENAEVRSGSRELNQICEICDSSFESAEDLKIHLLNHCGKQFFKCGACNWVATEREFIIQHIGDVHGDVNSGTPYEVEVTVTVDDNEAEEPVISKSYSQNADNHISYVRKEREQFECLNCTKKFSSKDSLRKHTTCHLEQRNFKCGECGKLYKRINHAREHLRVIHSNDRPFSCLICKKRFKTRSVMKTHLQVHENSLPYACDVCNKRFRQKGSLQRHQRIHTGEKPFICKYCGHEFSEHGSLNRHLKAKLPCYTRSSSLSENSSLRFVTDLNSDVFPQEK